MSTITKYAAPALGVLGVALAGFTQFFPDLIAAHPQLAGILGPLAIIIAAFAPQPHK